MTKPISQIKREGVSFLASLVNPTSVSEQKDFAAKLIADARTHGLSLRDYLMVKIDPKAGDDAAKFDGLNGYEASLAFLNLPVKDDLSNGISLQAAAETFQTYPGTRALFPEVMDDVVQWKYKQTNFEQVGNMLANSRTISGTELITTVVDDAKENYEVSAAIAELGRIPVYSIRSTENSVKMFKHGMGYRTSYEFERRAQIDLLVPYANRAIRQGEISKVAAATTLLINGDGVHAAASSVNQSSFNTAVGSNSTNNFISYKHLLHWLVSRAKAGYPIDTVVGNWDAYIQWLMMFAVPTSNTPRTDAENLAAAGFRMSGVPLLQGTVDFVLSSTAPANKLIGLSRSDTLEELVEAGSLIQESERSIQNQSIVYVRSEVTGYRIVFDGTREVFNYGA